MAVSEHDREYMRKLAKASAELDQETGPPSPETRRRIIREVNARRVKRGQPALEGEDEQIPELEFYRKARERGMLRRRPDPA